MQLRDCAGGVVFHGNKVFLLRNEKGEWVLPKGVIRNGKPAEDTALQSVMKEAGISADIIDSAGRTYYEFYSITRQRPVCNRIAWYVMDSETEDFHIGEPEKMTEAGFYPVAEALEMVTYSQDRSLLTQSYRKYCDKTGRAE
jgi:ADP-ribose pyrophosphatase YjhB (NUDIX family)